MGCQMVNILLLLAPHIRLVPNASQYSGYAVLFTYLIVQPSHSKQAGSVLSVGVNRLAVGLEVGRDLFAHPDVGLGRHLGAHVAVKRARVAALLHVAKHVLANAEHALALLAVQTETQFQKQTCLPSSQILELLSFRQLYLWFPRTASSKKHTH
jgi:hypothetical protein